MILANFLGRRGCIRFASIPNEFLITPGVHRYSMQRGTRNLTTTLFSKTACYRSAARSVFSSDPKEVGGKGYADDTKTVASRNQRVKLSLALVQVPKNVGAEGAGSLVKFSKIQCLGRLHLLSVACVLPPCLNSFLSNARSLGENGDAVTRGRADGCWLRCQY
jgi:hypothetical protein